MWTQILEHRRQIEQLRRALATQRLPHALLFSGPSGIGKRLVATELTAALFCPQAAEREGEACGTCIACRKLVSNNHPDFFAIEPETSESGAVQTIKIDPLRELSAKLQLHPLEAPVKIAIIDNADKMSLEAENSILKILEEPPPLTHFILITASPHRLLPTIRSRCQHLTFSPLPTEVIAAELTRRLELPEPEALRMARLAGGSLGLALSLDPAFVDSTMSRFLPLATRASTADVLALAEEWKGLEPNRIALLLDILASVYRDLLRTNISGGQTLPPASELRLPQIPEERALACLAEIARARSAADTAANKQLMFEQLLFSLTA